VTDKPLRCSFCDKSQDEVAHLVRGPKNDVFICNECVRESVEVIVQHAYDQARRWQLHAQRLGIVAQLAAVEKKLSVVPDDDA